MILNAQQSINDPSHLVLYEEWSDYDYFVNIEMKKQIREDFSKKLKTMFGDAPRKPSRMEFFEIIYDPGKS